MIKTYTFPFLILIIIVASSDYNCINNTNGCILLVKKKIIKFNLI